jgi:hypothetical protein
MPDFRIRPLDKPAAYSSLFQQTDAIEGLACAWIAEAHVVSHDVGTSVHTELLAREQEGGYVSRPVLGLPERQHVAGLATITAFQKLLSANETLPQAIAF